MKASYGYFTPDVYYEAMVARLVTPSVSWLDLGCGADIFPSNRSTAKRLAQTAKQLIGIDPSENIHRNPLLHRRIQGMLGDYSPTEPFDLITMRMVAEHVADPESLLSDIHRITRPGSSVVVYTVNWWSPVTMVSALTPMSIHHRVKALLWGTEEQDTFPVEYKMNTRRSLVTLFSRHGFDLAHFSRLSDCSAFARWPLSHRIELSLWRFLKTVGLGYPESCILAVFTRSR